jgi:DNA-binding phage protein
VNDAPEISDELDENIRQYLNTVVDDGEMLTEYFIVAATRTIDNGGQTFLSNKTGMPSYILEGMLRRAIWLIT